MKTHQLGMKFTEIAGAVSSEYDKTKGDKRKSLNNKSKTFHIFEGQTVSPTELKREVDLMKDEFEEWKTKYNNLELELKNLYEEMQKELEEKDKTIENLQSINQDLLNYIDMLEKNENVSYKGKDISEVKKRSRRLKTFSSKAQNALWFAKSFGLEFKSTVVAETKTGELNTVESTAQAQADGHEESHGFDALSDEEKQM